MLQLVKNPKSLDISEAEVEKQVAPFLKSILDQQKIRDDYTKTSVE